MQQNDKISFPLYDELLKNYRLSKFKQYNLTHECAVINSMLMNMKPEDNKIISETVYALIHHHESKKDSLKGEIAIGGVLLPFNSGVQYQMTNLPVVLQQMIIMFFNDLKNGKLPKSVT